jgi:putative hydrolase of the HAD superfamily
LSSLTGSNPVVSASMDAVLVDLYDTLVWSEWSILRERLSAETGADARRLMRAFVKTREARGVGTFGSAEGDLRAVLETAGLEPSDEQVRRIAAIVREVLVDGGGVVLYEDSLPALRALRARGIRTAIVSNCDHVTRAIVDRLRLAAEVDAVVLSFEVGVMKPDAGIYVEALERVGAKPEESAFVDDQPGYLDGAEAIGLRSFFIMRDGWELEAGDVRDRPVVHDLWDVLRQVDGSR